MPFLFKLAAALSLGAVHAGMWLWEDLSLAYCARCRKWLAFLSVVLTVLTLSLGAWGLRWVFRRFP